MYKLTIVSGPNRGASYDVQGEEISIGRQSDNSVMLSSSKVSKRHCVLVVNNGELLLKDAGSSNGTFVNGVLVKQKPVKAGDRIGVGEYVLEIVRTRPAAVSRPPIPGFMPGSSGAQPPMGLPAMSGIAGLPATGSTTGAIPVPGVPGVGSADLSVTDQSGPPRDPVGKALWYFDKYVMTFFYNMNLKNEWRFMGIGIFAVFLLVNLIVSVQPLLDSNHASILKEIGRRASFMARQIAERNAPYMAANAETKTDIGTLIERAEGVRSAFLADLDSRVIAPPSRMNTYLTSGEEARYASKAAIRFRNGEEKGFVFQGSGDTIIAIEPVKIFNSTIGRNVVTGMSLVSMDASSATLGFGETGTIYSETLILASVLGALMLLILYRLTLKPFEVLGEDMDKALKGELAQVTHEFKVEELNHLWEMVNTALQRIPKSGSTGPGDQAETGLNAEALVAPLRQLAEASHLGMVVLGGDRKIVFLNPLFDELSGIHADLATGQELGAVARDQSLGALATDMFDRAMGGQTVTEDYDFSGISCKVHVSAFVSTQDHSVKAYVMSVARTG